VKRPRAKTEQRIAFFSGGRLLRRRIGIGMMIIKKSEEMFSTALVIRWFVAVEHWTACLKSVQVLPSQYISHIDGILCTYGFEEILPNTG
jgi:hypothetical protein